MTKSLRVNSGRGLDFNFFVITIPCMKKGRGAPSKTSSGKDALLQIRLTMAEKQAFSDAAELDGKKVSEWIRDRLRRDSRAELEAHGKSVAFLPPKGDPGA